MFIQNITRYIVEKLTILQCFTIFVAFFVVPYLHRCFYSLTQMFCKIPCKKVIRAAKQNIWVLCKNNFEEHTPHSCYDFSCGHKQQENVLLISNCDKKKAGR
jgi:hypothetical protein